MLPRLAARARVDLVHSLASTAPLWGPYRRVVTVHDLIYARFPEAHAGVREKGMRVLVPAAARRAHRVIADSLSTRGDLIELLGLDPERIDVVPLGLGSVARAEPLPEREVRARLRLEGRQVVAEPVRQAAAQEPARAARGARAAACVAAARARAARLPDRARGRAARARARARPRRGRALSGLAGRARSSRACGRSRTPSCFPRCTRASGCPCWRRWRAACPSPAPTPPRCPRWRATRR